MKIGLSACNLWDASLCRLRMFIPMGLAALHPENLGFLSCLAMQGVLIVNCKVLPYAYIHDLTWGVLQPLC